MVTTVIYSGTTMRLNPSHAEMLLERFRSGESGVLSLQLQSGATTHIAYGPGIPFAIEAADF